MLSIGLTPLALVVVHSPRPKGLLTIGGGLAFPVALTLCAAEACRAFWFHLGVEHNCAASSVASRRN